MKITLSHIAIWSSDPECSRTFYQTYFDGVSNEKYTNPTKGFCSYFMTFGGQTTLEIMHRANITTPQVGSEHIGLAHMAFSVGCVTRVNTLTDRLRKDGHTIQSEPRTTGDGFYESAVLDPDGNLIEITE